MADTRVICPTCNRPTLWQFVASKMGGFTRLLFNGYYRCNSCNRWLPPNEVSAEIQVETGLNWLAQSHL